MPRGPKELQDAIDLAIANDRIVDLPAGNGIDMNWHQSVDGRGCRVVFMGAILRIVPPSTRSKT